MTMPLAAPRVADTSVTSVGLSDPSERPDFEDRRISARRNTKLSATLICSNAQAIAPCYATSISEGGIRVSVPGACRIAVGQRFEVLLYEGLPGDAPPDVFGDGHYATVVRTEAGADGPGGTAGVALCFDQPLFL